MSHIGSNLVCDHPGCKESFMGYGPNLNAARAAATFAAEKAGWLISVWNNSSHPYVDFCPEHWSRCDRETT